MQEHCPVWEPALEDDIQVIIAACTCGWTDHADKPGIASWLFQAHIAQQTQPDAETCRVCMFPITPGGICTPAFCRNDGLDQEQADWLAARSAEREKDVLAFLADSQVQEILRMMIMQTASIGRLRRDAGLVSTPTKVEFEQADVLTWMMTCVVHHGNDWRVGAEREIQNWIDTVRAMRAAAKAAQA